VRTRMFCSRAEPRAWTRAVRVHLALGLLMASFALAAPQAKAQTSRANTAGEARPAGRAGEPPGYRPLISEAVAEYDAGNFAEARSLFDKANTLYTTARALRGLGMVEFELRNYSDSVSFLEKALDSKVQPLEGKLRAETEALLGRARGFIAQLNVAVEPGAATVIVDGTPVQIGAQGRLVLEVGDHVLEFSAQGYVPEKRVMKVKGGEQQVLHITLPIERVEQPQLQVQADPGAPSATSAPAAATRADSGEPGRPLYKNPWLWTAVGVVVVGLAVGLGVGLTRDDPGQSPAVAQSPAASVVGP
jgi:hypothetical protein